MNKFLKFLGFDGTKTTVKTEIIAGVTTFMTMVYILMVNAGMFSAPWVGTSYGAAYIATAIGAIVGTLLMAFLAKMPLAQAPGMGVNAFIVYTLLLNGTGLTFANCMMFNLLKLGNGNHMVTYANGTVGGMLPAVVAIFGVMLVAILEHKKVKGSILWGILGSTVLYYIALGLGVAMGSETCKAIFADISLANPFLAFKDWGNQAVGKVFTEGFNFSGYTGTTGGLILLIVTTALSLCMIDMFDTIGTLYGACAKGDLLDENGVPLNMNRCMLADAIATCVGAIGGTSTVTTFVESTSGVAAGGKSGLTALVTACCFILAMFLSPIAQLVPRCATAAALMWVGVLMLTAVTKIDWTNTIEAVVGFFTFIVMLLGYSISKGIGMGILVYIFLNLCTGKVKDIKVSTWVIGVIYLATFLLT